MISCLYSDINAFHPYSKPRCEKMRAIFVTMLVWNRQSERRCFSYIAKMSPRKATSSATSGG